MASRFVSYERTTVVGSSQPRSITTKITETIVVPWISPCCNENCKSDVETHDDVRDTVGENDIQARWTLAHTAFPSLCGYLVRDGRLAVLLLAIRLE